VPGSSNYFLRGYVAYSNESKTDLLQVDPDLIQSKGAVSLEMAEAMARQCREKSGADVALSTTGIAGPGGATPGKPVGLVYIGIADDQMVEGMECRFSGGREAVKMKASQATLELLRRYCLQLPFKD